MVLKRVKQFYINISDKMTENDYDYAREILNDEEFDLFLKLSKSEQKHSIRIAKDIEFVIENEKTSDKDILNNKELLIRASLLHDIGKSRKRLNVIDKSIIVILNKLTNGKLKNIKKSQKIQCYYNHSEYGYEILKDLVNNDLILDIIRNHHKKSDNKIVSFFKTVDDRN